MNPNKKDIQDRYAHKLHAQGKCMRCRAPTGINRNTKHYYWKCLACRDHDSIMYKAGRARAHFSL